LRGEEEDSKHILLDHDFGQVALVQVLDVVRGKVCVRACVRVCVRACVRVCVCVCVCVCMQMCADVCICMYVCIYIYICICVCLCVYMYIYNIHTYTFVSRRTPQHRGTTEAERQVSTAAHPTPIHLEHILRHRATQA
jgi:hypothetical protein